MGTLLSQSAVARGRDTTLSGHLSPVENGCLVVSAFYFRVDCSIDGHPVGSNPTALPWVGPTLGPVYFQSGDPHGVPAYTPGPSDGQYEPPLTATITIDDLGTSIANDDLISGSFIVGAALRSHLSRVNEKSPIQRAVESWMTITHSLPPTAVHRATPNEHGGFDYEIASIALPKDPCLKASPDKCFPSPGAPLLTDGKWGAQTWASAGSTPVGRSPSLGGNVGGQTTAMVEDYRCADTAQSRLCAGGISLWGAAEDPGWDNVLLLVSSDAKGRVVRAQGFWVDEYRIEAGPAPLRGPPGEANSWSSGAFVLLPTNRKEEGRPP